MVLDGGDEVYVWLGKTSSPEEKEQSLEMAKVRFSSFIYIDFLSSKIFEKI